MGNSESHVGLFVPGHLAGELEKGFRMASPLLTIDLCKTVPDVEKMPARHLVAAAMEEFVYRRKRTVLWVNAQNTGELRKDLAMLLPGMPERIRVGMVHSAQDLRLIESLAEECALALPLRIELVVDNLHCYDLLPEIIGRSQWLTALTIGVADLWQSLPTARQTREELAAIKGGIVRLAQENNLLPLDAIHVNYLNLEQFTADCRKSKEMGFIGRPVIHPSQIKIAQQIYEGGDVYA